MKLKMNSGSLVRNSVGALLLLVCAGAAPAAENWRVLPLITGGKIDPAWAEVGFGGFRIDNGALRTECDPRGMGLLVYTKEKFGNARIRIVYRAEKRESNGGVFVRMDDGILKQIGVQTHGVTRLEGNKLSPEMLERMKDASAKQVGAWYAVHHGFEVQIQDSGDGMHRTGAIYSLAEAAPVPEKPYSEWRTMIITLEGERISVQVDGKQLSSFDAAARNLPERKSWSEPVRDVKRPTSGYIGLQNHDPGDVLWYKEVAVSKLDGR